MKRCPPTSSLVIVLTMAALSISACVHYPANEDVNSSTKYSTSEGEIMESEEPLAGDVSTGCFVPNYRLIATEMRLCGFAEAETQKSAFVYSCVGALASEACSDGGR